MIFGSGNLDDVPLTPTPSNTPTATTEDETERPSNDECGPPTPAGALGRCRPTINNAPHGYVEGARRGNIISGR